jgi:hypothetical protein
VSGSTYKLVCSHCHAPVRVRTSEGAHLQLRHLYLECTNLACAATFRGQLEVTHQLSPSGTPNPTVRLPLAPAAMRRKARADSLGERDDQFDLLEQA